MKSSARVITFTFLGLLLLGIHSAEAQRKKKKRQEQLKTVVVTARNYIGTPYRFGGNNKSGIDCSGLIHNSYAAAGIKIPRTAKEQSKYGKRPC